MRSSACPELTTQVPLALGLEDVLHTGRPCLAWSWSPASMASAQSIGPQADGSGFGEAAEPWAKTEDWGRAASQATVPTEEVAGDVFASV
jgi:hypothetical protein